MSSLSQTPEPLDLNWTFGDPIDLQFDVLSVDWSGAYTAMVRHGRGREAPLLLTLTVVATYTNPNTHFRLTATALASADVPAGGTYWWDLQQTGGRTRLAGRVFVDPDITV